MSIESGTELTVKTSSAGRALGPRRQREISGGLARVGVGEARGHGVDKLHAGDGDSW